LGILTVVHDLDHVRQGRSLPALLYVVAIAAPISIGMTLTVLVQYPQWTRVAAATQGVATVVGVGAVHAGSQWAGATDSYSAAHADGISWIIIVAMMLAGLTLVVISARTLAAQPSHLLGADTLGKVGPAKRLGTAGAAGS